MNSDVRQAKVAFDAGMLDKRIVIERKTVALDPIFGTEIVTWQSIAFIAGTVPQMFAAEIQDVLPSSTEQVKQGSIQVSASMKRVRMRYLAGIDSTMRVTVVGRTPEVFQIVSGVAVIGRFEGLEFMCEKFSS